MCTAANTISVIIPAFNRRSEIERAIASALGQTRPPDEIVVVDDGSTDGTAEAVGALGDKRIRLLRHAHNRGAAAARNTGIEAAKSDWIAFLDSDDEWDPYKLARQIEALIEAPDEMRAGVTGYVIRDYRTGEERRLCPASSDGTLAAMVWGCPLGPGSTLIVRREVFATVGLLDPSLARLEDWEWLMRYLATYTLGVLPEPLATVHKAGDPSLARVTDAVSRIRDKHRADWYRRSWLDGRKFDSTLLVEEAAAHYYARDFARAAILSLRALIAYPFRGIRFVALLWHRALRLLQGSDRTRTG